MGLPFPGCIEVVPKGHEVQVVGIPSALRRIAVIARRHLEAAHEALKDLEPHTVVHREVIILGVLQ